MNNIYNKLDDSIVEKINYNRSINWINPYACTNQSSIRRNMNRDKENIQRPAYVRDIEKIMHSPYYNRYADKTQVFSFFKNDDITRRAFHVQLVSRIARNIGNVLNLNNDLIEAIALGHDIGHTPFGHAGEKILNNIYYGMTGRYFNHNVHSVRVLDKIFERNISIQTLDGIICHNGEFEMKEYRPKDNINVEEFDEMVEGCYVDKDNIKKLIPMTLEGCVVRICDMIAYLGKDRQDAVRANMIPQDMDFTETSLGNINATMVNNLVVNIINNSYGKDYIMLDDEYFEALQTIKSENYKKIYQSEKNEYQYKQNIEPMMKQIFEKLIWDLKEHNTDSVIYTHHINFVNQNRGLYGNTGYEFIEPADIVVDYIASMTDDYFIDLYDYLFPKGKYSVKYVPYFERKSEL